MVVPEGRVEVDVGVDDDKSMTLRWSINYTTSENDTKTNKISCMHYHTAENKLCNFIYLPK